MRNRDNVLVIVIGRQNRRLGHERSHANKQGQHPGYDESQRKPCGCRLRRFLFEVLSRLCFFVHVAARQSSASDGRSLELGYWSFSGGWMFVFGGFLFGGYE